MSALRVWQGYVPRDVRSLWISTFRVRGKQQLLGEGRGYLWMKEGTFCVLAECFFAYVIRHLSSREVLYGLLNCGVPPE